MKLALKKGVVFTPCVEIVEVLPMVLLSYKIHSDIETVVVTSGNDSVHMVGSKHFSDEALDFRVWGLTSGERAAVVGFIHLATSIDYDVLDEGDHIHLEYDRK